MSAHQVYTGLLETFVLLHHSEQVLAHRFGLTTTLLRLLMQLHLLEGKRAVDLSVALLLDASTMTRLIDQLINLGFAARTHDCQDRRVQRITLTSSGEVVRNEAQALYARSAAARLPMLDEAEQAHLQQLLTTLCAGLRAALVVRE
jgi:DNA-binding MarR family transcriptional regulator